MSAALSAGKQFLEITALLVIAAPAAEARSPVITSAYTELTVFDWEHGCEVIDKKLDGERSMKSAVWRCRGYRNMPLFVRYDSSEQGGRGYDLDAGARDSWKIKIQPPIFPPSTIEWRLANERPFAIIYRLIVVDDDHYTVETNPSTLFVETTGTASKPGCRVAEIDGGEPNASVAARRAADAVLRGQAKCLGSLD